MYWRTKYIIISEMAKQLWLNAEEYTDKNMNNYNKIEALIEAINIINEEPELPFNEKIT